jgi:hypothetical protein
VAGCCECGDEPSGSGSTERVKPTDFVLVVDIFTSYIWIILLRKIVYVFTLQCKHAQPFGCLPWRFNHHKNKAMRTNCTPKTQLKGLFLVVLCQSHISTAVLGTLISTAALLLNDVWRTLYNISYRTNNDSSVHKYDHKLKTHSIRTSFTTQRVSPNLEFKEWNCLLQQPLQPSLLLPNTNLFLHHVIKRLLCRYVYIW